MSFSCLSHVSRMSLVCLSPLSLSSLSYLSHVALMSLSCLLISLACLSRVSGRAARAQSLILALIRNVSPTAIRTLTRANALVCL